MQNHQRPRARRCGLKLSGCVIPVTVICPNQDYLATVWRQTRSRSHTGLALLQRPKDYFEPSECELDGSFSFSASLAALNSFTASVASFHFASAACFTSARACFSARLAFFSAQVALLSLALCALAASNAWSLSCTRFRRHRVRCFMEQEVRHGEKAVYPGVQA
jgi:hypothetical protein